MRIRLITLTEFLHTKRNLGRITEADGLFLITYIDAFQKNFSVIQGFLCVFPT